MFEPSNTSFTFSRQPRTFGPDLLVATLTVTTSVHLPDNANRDDAQLLIDEKNWQVYYGDCIKSLAAAKDFSINTCSSYECRQHVEAAFARVEEIDLPKIPYEATVDDVGSGHRAITAMSGYVAWLPFHPDFRPSDIEVTEDHLVWAIRSYYFENFLNRAISAQHDAMIFSAAGYEAVGDKFQPVFDSTRIKVPFERLNY
jgi:hypothetical protein